MTDISVTHLTKLLRPLDYYHFGIPTQNTCHFLQSIFLQRTHQLPMSDSCTDSSYERKIAKLSNACLNTTSKSYADKHNNSSSAFDNVNDPSDWYSQEPISHKLHISKGFKFKPNSSSRMYAKKSVKVSHEDSVYKISHYQKQFDKLKAELRRRSLNVQYFRQFLSIPPKVQKCLQNCNGWY